MKFAAEVAVALALALAVAGALLVHRGGHFLELSRHDLGRPAPR